MKKILLALAAAAVLAPAATAGGWATVGLGSLPPDDLAAGSTWTVDLTVLQHAKTPLDGVQPVVRLTRTDGTAGGEFSATPTGEPGVYRAAVTFPSGGTWRYEIDDGFSQTHTFQPVEVGPASAPASFPTVPVAGIVLALMLVTAVAVFLLGRRPGPHPAPLGG